MKRTCRLIRAISEWPFDTAVMTRLGFYLINPPMTWVGAAMLENLVENLVEALL